ncbi:MAG: PEP-CTERM sorting domain-containing protein [Sulfuriferula sp.]
MKSIKLLSVAAVMALGVAGNASAVDITTPGGKFVITGLGSGSGSWYKVPAVPEADTWAMMAVGLGLVGLRLRRKNQDDAK